MERIEQPTSIIFIRDSKKFSGEVDESQNQLVAEDQHEIDGVREVIEFFTSSSEHGGS